MHVPYTLKKIKMGNHTANSVIIMDLQLFIQAAYTTLTMKYKTKLLEAQT